MLAAVKAVKCENVANFTGGFEFAFEMLHRVIVFLYNFFFLNLNKIIFHVIHSIINRDKAHNVIKQ